MTPKASLSVKAQKVWVIAAKFKQSLSVSPQGQRSGRQKKVTDQGQETRQARDRVAPEID